METQLNREVFAGIVTYNPDVKLLKKNIDSILCQVERVIIVDNCSANVSEFEYLTNRNEITFIQNISNKGIATALNQIMKNSLDNSIDWVITLDQDSVSPEGLVANLKKRVKIDVGIVAAKHVDRNNPPIEDAEELEQELVEWTITSGSLTSTEAWNKIGGFDEYLFIDGVDVDYCKRLREKGYKIVKDNSTIISHAVGEAEYHKIGKYTISVKNHSAFRKYYIVRNLIIIAKKGGRKRSVLKAYLQVVKQVVLVSLFEKNKYVKIVALIMGVRDAEKYKLDNRNDITDC